jgi:hypothetical protein
MKLYFFVLLCETWSLKLGKEHKLRVFENRVLRTVGGSGWIKLHIEELHNFYTSSDIFRVIKSRKMRWAGHVTRMDALRNPYNIFVGKPEGKGPLGRRMRRWEDNIRMDLRQVGWKFVDWIFLAQDRDKWRAHVNTVGEFLD